MAACGHDTAVGAGDGGTLCPDATVSAELLSSTLPEHFLVHASDDTADAAAAAHQAVDGRKQQDAVHAWRVVLANWVTSVAHRPRAPLRARNDWGPRRWRSIQQRDPRSLRDAIRRGVPPALRGAVWMTLGGAGERMAAGPGVYAALLESPATEHEPTISRDICRTFPKHQLFSDLGGMGQRSMFNVLRAYASYDPRIGYCQGMGFITGLFLAHVGEEEAFWLLVAVIDRCGMRGLFSVDMPDFPHVMHTLETQLARHMPALSEHLAEQGVQPSMFASQWMITVFTSNFPFDVVTRVWDVFLAEGWTAVYRAALGVLSLAQDELLKLDLEGALHLLRRFPQQVEPDDLLSAAMRIPLRRRDITADAVP